MTIRNLYECDLDWYGNFKVEITFKENADKVLKYSHYSDIPLELSEHKIYFFTRNNDSYTIILE